MALTSVWDQLKRNKLTFGYVRSLSERTPESIVDLILIFYDDMKYWTITAGKQMTKFFSCKCEEIMYGPKFIMKNIEFQCIVAPNGYEAEHEGRVALILSVAKLPPNVKYVYVYFILFCQNIKYEHKVTRILTENNDNVRQQQQYKWSSKFPWATNAVNRSDLSDLSPITFGYYVDIMHVVYDQSDQSMAIDTLSNKERESVTLGFVPSFLQQHVDLILKYEGNSYWSKQIEISSKYEYVWRVNKDRLIQMQHCHHGQHFYSPNFDQNNWCLYISPAGWTQDNKDLFSFQLKLLQKPYRLAAVYVVYRLQTNFEQIAIQNSKIFHYKNCRSGWDFEQHKISFEAFQKLDQIVIKLDLKILAGYDIRTRHRIETKNWKRYGIV